MGCKVFKAKGRDRDSPAGLVVKTMLPFTGSICVQGTAIPHAVGSHIQKVKKKKKKE